MCNGLELPGGYGRVSLGVYLAVGLPLLVLVGVMIYFYNRFKVLENRCDEAWSNVGTELRRRHELVPNLVAAVKGYAAHEKAVTTEATRLRRLQDRVDLSPREAEQVERRMGRSMGRLLAVAEAYPDLQASANFLELQKELSDTEDRIQAARRFYNGNVRDHRNATRQFPGTLFAAMFRPPTQDFFQVDPVVAKAPTVALVGPAQ